jgi:adenine-specific DNA-methyltransferase
MTTVFIGGSRQVSGLEAEVCDRLDRIVAKGLPVLIGDAGGADEAVQRYFRGRGFGSVTVSSVDDRPRHNFGGWPVRVIQPGRARKDLAHHATKDRAMAAEATVGLMLWDGRSRGTLMNVLRLAAQDKPVVVYVQPRRSFVEVRRRLDLPALLAGLERQTASRLWAAAAAEGLGQGFADLEGLRF